MGRSNTLGLHFDRFPCDVVDFRKVLDIACFLVKFIFENLNRFFFQGHADDDCKVDLSFES